MTSSEDATARVWDATSGAEINVLNGHNEWIGRVAITPDGARIITASRDKTARFWDARTGAQLAVLKGQHCRHLELGGDA